MQRIKKLTAIILSILTLSSVCVFGGAFSAGASGTGAGLAEWALNAYYEGWSYVYGGSTPGAVDCSGLIYSYCGGERCGDPQLNTATERGSVSNGIPNVHGLGLWRPGHVGVYVGDGMEVDARGDAYDMCYESVYGSYSGWTYWFKLAAVSYPTNGWEKFSGDYYYYENGEYITNTSRTIDGTTYYFDSKGRSSKTPSDTSGSSSSSSSNNSGSSSNSSSQSKPTSWRNGSTGEEVKKIQNRLAELGYYTGAVDGSFGDATEKAYRAFQEAAGLTVDGIAGSDREVLYSDDAPPYAPKTEETTAPADEEKDDEKNAEDEEKSAIEFKSGDESDDVKAIQGKLAELKYFDVDPTGYYGDYTVQTVMNFQLANGLEATGIIDEATYKLLFSTDAVVNPNPTESTDEQSATVAVESGPVQMPLTTSPSELIIANEQNQSYTDTATDVVKKTNKVTKKALSNSSSVIPSAATAEVKRTANIWLWFVLVAVILGALAVVFMLRDRKSNRYAKYCSKKKKHANFKSEVNTRW
ncbi:MAG: peptidoglycan-binding protein [Ruminococcus sp.]